MRGSTMIMLGLLLAMFIVYVLLGRREGDLRYNRSGRDVKKE
jgi:hypothetical protein